MTFDHKTAHTKLRLVLRKLRVIRIVVTQCKNWLPVCLARFGVWRGPSLIRHRNGVAIELLGSLQNDWGQVFEPLLADVYEIASGDSIDVILDVGANVGSFTALAARCHPDARIIAYEPNDAVIPILKRNLIRNGISHAVVIPRPLAATSREVVFFDSGGGGSSSYVLQGENPRTMRTTTLDEVDWSNARHLFIKLDCEGSEGEILEWIAQRHEALPPRTSIACEYHSWCPVPIANTVRRLESIGFTVRQTSKFDEPYLIASRRSGPPTDKPLT